MPNRYYTVTQKRVVRVIAENDIQAAQHAAAAFEGTVDSLHQVERVRATLEIEEDHG